RDSKGRIQQDVHRLGTSSKELTTEAQRRGGGKDREMENEERRTENEERFAVLHSPFFIFHSSFAFTVARSLISLRLNQRVKGLLQTLGIGEAAVGVGVQTTFNKLLRPRPATALQ